MNSQNHPLSINQSFALSVNALPPELAARFDLYPENKRRPINKTLFKNDYFQLTCNMRDQTLNVCSQGTLFIPQSLTILRGIIFNEQQFSTCCILKRFGNTLNPTKLL